VPGRVDAICGALGAAWESCFAVGAVGDGLPAAVTAIHAREYLEYLRTIHGVWHGEFKTDVLPDTFPRRVAARPGLHPHAGAGQFCFDLAAPITAGTWEAAVNSAGVAIAAAEAVLTDADCAYALCRPPGHHAGADYCGGFCYLNNVAIAAQHLLLSGKKKVAILDVDYHHGNGTQDIFYRRSDVLFVSLHADPNAQYPYFWGGADETGEGEGAGYTVNLPLARRSSAATWFAALDVALERIGRFGAEALLVSFGADTHEQDSVGDFQLTFEDFERMGQHLRSLRLPTAFVQEGGYNLETLGACVQRTLGAFSKGV
jgi:acetoin utilization deacetylase AcuC-like enzyme